MKEYIKNCKAKKTRVVSKLVTDTGNTYYGVNVESSCPTLSVCAERAALINAVTQEGPTFKIESMEVYAEKEGKVLDILPCGGCRQLIAEFSTELSVILGHPLQYWMPNPYL